MPIKIPDDLPARATLDAEGVMVMRETDAVRQDIRPMRIGLLNLMPNKIKTETQIARLLGATPLQVELSLVKITNHVARNTPSDHIITFYRSWEDIQTEKFDGFIVTGAPVETLPFEEVTYWDELRRIFDWTQTNVHGSFHICWGAQAAVHHFHGMPKYPLAEKAFGVFRHRNLAPTSPYLRGFSDDFSIPVSRWTEMRREDIPAKSGLTVLMESDEAGLCLLDDPAHRSLHMFNHIEYDSNSLSDEYFRDVAANKPIAIPHN
jgi:homoserine O-succinyltransferase